MERSDGRGPEPALSETEGDLSLRLLFRDWEACRAVAVMEEEGSYEIASLRSQRQGVVFARSLSDEAISLYIDLRRRVLDITVSLMMLNRAWVPYRETCVS